MTDRKASERRHTLRLASIACALLGLIPTIGVTQTLEPPASVATYTEREPGAASTVVQPESAPSAVQPETAASAARPEAASDETLQIEVREVRERPAVTPTLDLTENPANLWDRIRHGFSMPNLVNPLVLERTEWYAARPAQIKIMVQRSRRYLFHIVEELEKRGMPTELALLPMVESAFNPMAYSRAHASGLWQFIPSTGKTYNLSQNWWYDGRRDIVASTNAALDYLQTIYEMHGDWHLALASYNWGENAVARAVERNRRMELPTDYSSLPMPEETRYYVPKLQALKNIIANPAAFGIELDDIPNAPYFATVTLTRDIDLKVAARLAEMPLDELIALNPAHNRPVVSSAQAPTLVLPADRLDRFMASLGAYDKPLSAWRTVNVQRGERLDRIAAAHGTTVETLRSVNGIRGNGRLASTVELLVPAPGMRAEVPSGLFQQLGIETESDRPAAKVGDKRGKHVAAKASKGRAVAHAEPRSAKSAPVKRTAAAAKPAGKVQVARRN